MRIALLLLLCLPSLAAANYAVKPVRGSLTLTVSPAAASTSTHIVNRYDDGDIDIIRHGVEDHVRLRRWANGDIELTRSWHSAQAIGSPSYLTLKQTPGKVKVEIQRVESATEYGGDEDDCGMGYTSYSYSTEKLEARHTVQLLLLQPVAAKLLNETIKLIDPDYVWDNGVFVTHQLNGAKPQGDEAQLRQVLARFESSRWQDREPPELTEEDAYHLYWLSLNEPISPAQAQGVALALRAYCTLSPAELNLSRAKPAVKD